MYWLTLETKKLVKWEDFIVLRKHRIPRNNSKYCWHFIRLHVSIDKLNSNLIPFFQRISYSIWSRNNLQSRFTQLWIENRLEIMSVKQRWGIEMYSEISPKISALRFHFGGWRLNKISWKQMEKINEKNVYFW